MAAGKRIAKTLILLGFVCTFSSCKQKSMLPTQVWFAMDTVCTVNAFEDGNEKLYGEIGSFLAKMENTFSATLETSTLYIQNAILREQGATKEEYLNGVGVEMGYNGEVSNHFVKVLLSLQKVWELTDGALDVTMDPLIRLWDIKSENPRVPSEAEIEKALGQGGYNFGAVVKGYATDCIVEILERHKVKRAIVDLGGNIYVYGEKPDKSPWTVGIKNPADPNGTPIYKLQTESASVVTSGNYERFFEIDGKRYHHILDPKTGWPVDNGIASVTIVSKSSFACDILSTTCFVLGQEKSLELKSQLENLLGVKFQVIFITTDGQVSVIEE